MQEINERHCTVTTRIGNEWDNVPLNLVVLHHTINQSNNPDKQQQMTSSITINIHKNMAVDVVFNVENDTIFSMSVYFVQFNAVMSSHFAEVE